MSMFLKILIMKLNLLCCYVIEWVVSVCLVCGYYEVDLEYLFFVLFDEVMGDLLFVLCVSCVDLYVLYVDFECEFMCLKIGNMCMLVFFVYLIVLFEQVWLIVLFDLQFGCIWLGYLLFVLLIVLDFVQFV